MNEEQKGLRISRGFKSKITRHYLEKALNKDGKTMVEIAKEFGLTRERVRQVCEEWEITVRRTPEWYANRIGIPELADKKWLVREVKRAGGARLLSREIGTSPNLIYGQARRMGINSLKVCYVEMVEITCEICGKKKEKQQSTIKRNTHSFCSKVCQGKWLAKHSQMLWMPEEEDFIRLNYEKMSDREMAEKLGRTRQAVSVRRTVNLQLKKREIPREWSQEEIAFLKTHYLKMSDKEIAKRLGRTEKSILRARIKRGLRKK